MFKLYFNKIFHFLNYDIYFPLSFIFLIILSLIFFSKKEETKKLKGFLFLGLLIIIVFLIWSLGLTLIQYSIWGNHPISKYLLPPYQKIDYFLNYSFIHFWHDLLWRIITALFVYLFLIFLNFVFQRDIFYEEEKILLPLLSFFYFFPYNLIFVFSGFFVLLLIIMIKILRSKENLQRYFSFKNYWLFLAWFFFILGPLFLTNYEFLKYKP